MRLFCSCLLCLASVLLMSAEWQPVKAEIHRNDGKIDEFFVQYEDIEKIVCTQDPNLGWAELPQKLVARVDYEKGLIENINYAQAMGALKRGDHDRALKSFQRCLDERRQALQIYALLGIADLHRQAERYDEAIASLQQIIKDHSSWPRLAQIVAQIGDLQLAADKPDAADSTYQKLNALAARYGQQATILSLRGQARVQVAKAKPAEAVTLLQQAFEEVDVSTNPASKAAVALELAQQQEAAEQLDAALANLRSVQFLPLEPKQLAQVHIALSGILRAQKQWVAGFDHGIMAAVIEGIDDTVKREALTAAFRISKQIDEDPAFTPEQRLQFRQALTKP
jgi:tetratricopeptide (TPR) repeat protein